MLKATSVVDIKSNQSVLKSVKISLADYNEDKEGVTGELNAVLAYLNELMLQCETNVAPYEETKAQR